MAVLTRSRAAALFALPAVLVPVIEIPLVLWARWTFLRLHPDYLDTPPTISRAINDPLVGEPFANFILLITALIMFTVPIMAWAYGLAISRLDISTMRRTRMYGLLGSIIVLQSVASSGMVMTTQFTFHIDHDLHMMGSYIFFCFQALAIIVAATLCRMLHRAQRAQGIDDGDWLFVPFMHRFRFRFALVILGLVVLYGIFFAFKDSEALINPYAMQVIYTQCEVIVIGCYVLFLGSYAVDIHHMIRSGKLPAPGQARLKPAATPLPRKGR